MGRADNDTWDLASSVGVTATVVAMQRAIATRSNAAQVNDPYAEPLVSAVGVDFYTRYARVSAPGSRIATENIGTVSSEELQKISARMRATQQQWQDKGIDLGEEVDVAELFYAGERTEAATYLAGRGWATAPRKSSDLFAAYGLPPSTEALSSFGDIVYLSATLG